MMHLCIQFNGWMPDVNLSLTLNIKSDRLTRVGAKVYVKLISGSFQIDIKYHEMSWIEAVKPFVVISSICFIALSQYPSSISAQQTAAL